MIYRLKGSPINWDGWENDCLPEFTIQSWLRNLQKYYSFKYTSPVEISIVEFCLSKWFIIYFVALAKWPYYIFHVFVINTITVKYFIKYYYISFRKHFMLLFHCHLLFFAEKVEWKAIIFSFLIYFLFNQYLSQDNFSLLHHLGSY